MEESSALLILRKLAGEDSLNTRDVINARFLLYLAGDPQSRGRTGEHSLALHGGSCTSRVRGRGSAASKKGEGFEFGAVGFLRRRLGQFL